MKNRRIAGNALLILYIAVTAFIFINSSRNAAESSAQSSGIAELFRNIYHMIFRGSEISYDRAVHIVRKTAHFTEFAFQGALLSGFLICRFKGFNVIYVLFSGLFTACCDEFIQLFSEGRSSEVKDIFIDFSGCIAAAVLYTIIYIYIKRGKNTV